MEQIKFTEISEIDSIKNSKFYDIIKDFDILKMNSEQKEVLKIFILSLSEEEQESVMIKFVDNDYGYMRNNDERNEKMEIFLSDSRFEPIYDNIIKNLPSFEKIPFPFG